jgi:tetratricopeptide (TPR) repeat protein
MTEQTMLNDYDRRSEELWASIDQYDEEVFRAKIEELVAELPADSAVAAFERACALDSTGHPDQAVPFYRRALELGLEGERRRRAVIQLSSSLRNLDHVSESLELLTAEREQPSDRLDDAVSAFLALALVDSGREREATSVALAALAPHLPRYQRSVGNYARKLVDGE